MQGDYTSKKLCHVAEVTASRQIPATSLTSCNIDTLRTVPVYITRRLPMSWRTGTDDIIKDALRIMFWIGMIVGGIYLCTGFNIFEWLGGYR